MRKQYLKYEKEKKQHWESIHEGCGQPAAQKCGHFIFKQRHVFSLRQTIMHNNTKDSDRPDRAARSLKRRTEKV